MAILTGEHSGEELPGTEYKKFVIDLLYRRHSIENLLQLKHNYLHASYEGFRRNDYQPPSCLMPMLGAVDQSAGIAATLGFAITKFAQANLRLDSVTVASEDRPPIVVAREQSPDGIDIVIAKQNDVFLALEDDELEASLRGFLPIEARKLASLKQITNALGLNSDEKEIAMSFVKQGDDFVGEVRFSDIETFKDSIQVLEVICHRIYTDNATIGTRLRITESLLQRSDKSNRKSVNQILDTYIRPTIEEPIITVEDILDQDGYSIEVKHPTQRHIKDIKGVLKLLNKHRLNTTNPST